MSQENTAKVSPIRTPEGKSAYDSALAGEYVALLEAEAAADMGRKDARSKARKVLRSGIPTDPVEFHHWALSQGK